MVQDSGIDVRAQPRYSQRRYRNWSPTPTRRRDRQKRAEARCRVVPFLPSKMPGIRSSGQVRPAAAVPINPEAKEDFEDDARDHTQP